MIKNSITKNYIYNLIYQILIIIIPIILIPYISRTLLSDAVGEYSYSFSIVTYFVTFSMLGIVYYGNRQISIKKENAKELNQTFWGIFIFKALISLAALLIYIILIQFVLKIDNKPLYMIQGIFIISVLFDISWFFTGVENFKSILIRNLVIKFTSIILIFILIKKPSDLVTYAIILAASELFGQVLMWISLPKYNIKFNKKELKEYEVFTHGKGLFILFLPRAAIQIYTTVNVTMLGFYTNNSEVAYYDYANKIVSILLAVVTSVGIVMLPRISSMKQENKNEEINKMLDRSLRLMFYIGIPIMFGLMAVSGLFVPWFLGESFNYVSVLLLYLPIKIIFVMISNVTGIQYLISHNRNKEFFISSLIGGVLSITFNLLFIKSLGSLGAVFSLVLAEFGVAAAQIYFVRKDLPIMKSILKTWKIFLSGLIMFVVIYLLSKYSFASLVKTVTNTLGTKVLIAEAIVTMLFIMFGALVYLLSVIILKEPLNKFFKDKIKNILKRNKTSIENKEGDSNE